VPLSIHIEAFGETVVQRDLLRFGHNVVNLKPAMERIGVIMRGAVRQQFLSEGTHGSGGSTFAAAASGATFGSGGVAWEPLAASTVQYKALHGLDPRILRATTDLYKSLTVKSDAQHIERASEDSLRFGSLVPYAVYHQSSKPRTKIPFRPPVGLSEGDKRAIVAAIHKRAMEGVGG
jgi:phage gpG-like protein